jgi:hypothetical protein
MYYFFIRFAALSMTFSAVCLTCPTAWFFLPFLRSLSLPASAPAASSIRPFAGGQLVVHAPFACCCGGKTPVVETLQTPMFAFIFLRLPSYVGFCLPGSYARDGLFSMGCNPTSRVSEYAARR